MKRPIRPAWLLRLARELVPEAAGQGQPRNTNLRRATSTAYYALFHAIASGAAEHALPAASDAERHSYTRYVSHTSIKAVCGWIAGDAPPVHLTTTVSRLRQNPTLSDVAATFLALHEARESADYDHDADMTRPTTLSLIRRSELAIRAVETDATTVDFRGFFGLLALKTGIRGG